MLNRSIPIFAIICLFLPSAHAQEGDAALRARLERALSLQVRTLRQISHATTEPERNALATILDEEGPAWPSGLQGRIDSAQRHFETLRCPRGTTPRRDEEGAPFCIHSDGSEESPTLSRWMWQDDELLYACTYTRDSESETQMCSRLNLLTDELIGRTLEDAFDSSYLQAEAYAISL